MKGWPTSNMKAPSHLPPGSGRAVWAEELKREASHASTMALMLEGRVQAHERTMSATPSSLNQLFGGRDK